MDCQADWAAVSWQPSIGAVSYVGIGTASSGDIARCATNQTNCHLSSLQCGEEYNVTVEAVGEICNSTAQMAGYLTTGVCHIVYFYVFVFVCKHIFGIFLCLCFVVRSAIILFDVHLLLVLHNTWNFYCTNNYCTYVKNPCCPSSSPQSPVFP